MSDQAKKEGDKPSGVRNVLAGASSNTGRLSSFRTERDMTLGGVQRKTFAPKIPAKKTKEEIIATQRAQPVAEPSNNPSSDRGQRGRRGRNDRGRGRGRGGDRGRGRGRGIVESNSIFSAGPGERTNRQGNWQRSMGGGSVKREPGVSGGAGNFGGGQRSVKLEGGFSNADDDGDYNALFGDEEEEAACEEDYLAPVQLPLTQLSISEPEVAPAVLFGRPADDDQEDLIFMQLPDSFPASLVKNNGEDTEPMDTVEKEKEKEKEADISLDNLPEGYIGKLQVRKSGRVQIVLGGVALDVTAGSRRPCLQQAVSMRAAPEVFDTTEAPAGLFFLGNVKHHLVCTPNFETMISNN
ncbi:DNA-directed RNA polymerase III subunit RPC4-like [Sycon ciliatum]|uniref:DNA-directed RNA polymerase III subunit RPC4-like n=1 Tax=Sycon ciliatum TaxID=27933 RepID=UPI0020AC6A26|eukprot:scpid67128/ scgid10788/ DNA-directed RNA polymerase III subunit RPC4; DNA-directed RNA polymerase III subunit D